MNRRRKMPKEKKEIQGETYCIEGGEFVKLKPFSFQNFIKTNICEDCYDLLIDFAKKFGTDKDVSFKDLVKFLNDNGWDEWDDTLEWLEKRKFIKEINGLEPYKLKTKFYDGKEELIVISIYNKDIGLLNLSTGKCPYGHVDTRRADSITRAELWELLEHFENEEFVKFISTAH
jgi:hypothetical protein